MAPSVSAPTSSPCATIGTATVAPIVCEGGARRGVQRRIRVALGGIDGGHDATVGEARRHVGRDRPGAFERRQAVRCQTGDEQPGALVRNRPLDDNPRTMVAIWSR